MLNERMPRHEAQKKARQLIEQMTLSEKVAQISHRAPAIERLGIKKYHYWNEGLHGVARAGLATVFPQAIGLAATFDENTLLNVAEVIATEGRAKYNDYRKQNDFGMYKGLTYWSPNINIFRDPRWGRGHETYGEDPYLTSRLAIGYIKGLQGNEKYIKVAACAKHFAVHSGPEANRHEFDSKASEKDLRETYLPAFEAAVKEADVEAVMAAYNSVNGVPSPVNHQLLKEILRDEWFFEGHVVSDAGALTDVHKHHRYTHDGAETMALAIKEGCDLCVDDRVDDLFIALGKGLVTEEEIDVSLERIFTTRVLLGMFDEDCPFNEIPFGVVDCEAHRKLALETAYQSFVLLKNSENFLPLNQAAIKKIAVIGPNADNKKALEGNYMGTASRYTTILNGIQDFFEPNGKVLYSEGCHLYKSSLESFHEPGDRESEAISMCEKSEVALVCLGLDPTLEGEEGDAHNIYGSGDKPTLELPGRQLLLLEKVLNTGIPVVLIVAAGSAITLGNLQDHPNLKAILHVWYPGSQGGKAVANVLFGAANPTGKLPVTFYKSLDELPAFEDYSMINRTYKYTKESPLYPFGYGLTYSETTVKSAEIIDWDDEKHEAKIQVSIENKGLKETEEVVQVYVKNKDSIHATFNHKLIAFKRVPLKVGETKKIIMPIPRQAFEVTDEAGNTYLDGENYTFFVGTSQPDARSKELLNKETIEIDFVRT